MFQKKKLALGSGSSIAQGFAQFSQGYQELQCICVNSLRIVWLLTAAEQTCPILVSPV